MEPAKTAKDAKVYVLVNYDDAYVQPIILRALRKRLPASSYEQVTTLDDIPSPSSKVFQFLQYEEIDFEHILSNPSTSLCNAYIIRKALIRKHYLSTTVGNWITKHPNSILKKHVKPSVEFEVDYAEFLDDALVEAWELQESWGKGAGKSREEREWWILKPGMSERGQGIRLFSSEEELVSIFEGWDPESDDEEEEEEEEDQDARSDHQDSVQWLERAREERDERNGIITSQLRHFIAQPYIHPPLLLPPPTGTEDQAFRKFHIRTYVLSVGALKVYIYKDMLALFAAKPYIPPWESSFDDDADALKSHLTNTCLQDTNEREGSVGLFWSLPATIPTQPPTTALHSPSSPPDNDWKQAIFSQICSMTGEVFEAAARSMSIHFQPLPNSFEIFGLDFMIGVESDGELRSWLLEVNAFPDFRQTGEELKGLVEGLFEGVVDVGIKPFFGLGGDGDNEDEKKGDKGGGLMVKVLDIDLGRR